MEIGNILGKIRGGENTKPKNFLAIELTDEIVQAAVWQVIEGQTVVSAIGTPISWDGDIADGLELVTAADGTISSATEGIEGDPDEVIFGVSPSWAGEDGILPEKLKLIKSICTELELKPLGFVVVTDSLLRYLKMQEGTPSTSILVQVSRDNVTVTLVKLGKLISSETLGRSDDISADVEEGISRFQSPDELPSLILVYDGMQSLDEEVQNLISYDWQSKFNFLHIPKIERLPKDVLIRSIAVAGGSEVAKSIGFEITDTSDLHQSSINSSDVSAEHSIEKVSNVAVPVNSSAVDALLTAEDFGFVPAETALPDKKPVESAAPFTPQPSRIDLTEAVADPEEDVEVAEPVPVKSSRPKFSMPSFNLPRVSLPVYKLPPLRARRPIIIGFAVLILALIALGSAIWLVPQATVTVYVEPKSLEENIDLTLNTAISAIDMDSRAVPAESVEKVMKGEESTMTTGKKTVGDQSSGEVTIYNRTQVTKTFPKDTVLTAKSLKFSLAESVTVASKSAGSDYVDVPGKATVKIVARNIGSEGNLESGTEFTLENFSKDTYVAKNDKSLTGGSSREVQVASKDDFAKLKKSLTDRLKNEGKDALLAEIGEGKGIFVLTDGSKITDESYSVEEGEEASNLTASFEVAVKGVSYSTTDVETLTDKQIADSQPDGYVRTADPPEVILGDIKSEDETGAEIQAKIIVKLLPVVDRSVVAQALRGVASGEVDEHLTSVIGLKNAEVEITPKWLPPRFKRMPRNPVNIVVTIVPAE